MSVCCTVYYSWAVQECLCQLVAQTFLILHKIPDLLPHYICFFLSVIWGFMYEITERVNFVEFLNFTENNNVN